MQIVCREFWNTVKTLKRGRLQTMVRSAVRKDLDRKPSFSLALRRHPGIYLDLALMGDALQSGQKLGILCCRDNRDNLT